MFEKIEVFYTGGGITIAEADINTNQYAVVSTEAPEFFTIYAYADEEKTYLPDDMIASHRKDELAPNLLQLYSEMLNKLKSE